MFLWHFLKRPKLAYKITVAEVRRNTKEVDVFGG